MKRDFRIESSYKFSFFLEIFKSLVPTLSFYFVGKLVPPGAYFPGDHSGQYFSFAVVGVAFSQYLSQSLGAFGDTIRRQQLAGCLEAILSTRTRPAMIILYSPLYSFIAKGYHLVFVLAFGSLFLGVDFSRMNPASALLVFLFSVLPFSSLGIISATIIIIWKKGDPVSWAIGTFGALLGGAYFPRGLLPGWLAMVSEWNPISLSLDAMRLALYKGCTPSEIGAQLFMLAGMGALTIPATTWLFSKAVQKCRCDGTLLQY